jgi:hypothetical protein
MLAAITRRRECLPRRFKICARDTLDARHASVAAYSRSSAAWFGNVDLLYFQIGHLTLIFAAKSVAMKSALKDFANRMGGIPVYEGRFLVSWELRKNLVIFQ